MGQIWPSQVGQAGASLTLVSFIGRFDVSPEVPEHQQLTTQRAADILGVSRPFLVRLLENGDMPFHMVGSHRRIYLRDLLDYKRRRDAARHQAINNMARAEMEAGTYDKVVLPEGAEDE